MNSTGDAPAKPKKPKKPKVEGAKVEGGLGHAEGCTCVFCNPRPKGAKAAKSAPAGDSVPAGLSVPDLSGLGATAFPPSLGPVPGPGVFNPLQSLVPTARAPGPDLSQVVALMTTQMKQQQQQTQTLTSLLAAAILAPPAPGLQSPQQPQSQPEQTPPSPAAGDTDMFITGNNEMTGIGNQNLLFDHDRGSV